MNKTIVQELSQEVVNSMKEAYYKKIGMENLLRVKESVDDSDLIKMGELTAQYEDLGFSIARKALEENQGISAEDANIESWSVDFIDSKVAVTYSV